MQLWTEIRNFSDLKQYQKDFRLLSQDEQDEIIAEMIVFMRVYKEQEAQQDLFRAKGVDKSTKSTLIKAKRPRRHRGAYQRRLV